LGIRYPKRVGCWCKPVNTPVALVALRHAGAIDFISDCSTSSCNLRLCPKFGLDSWPAVSMNDMSVGGVQVDQWLIGPCCGPTIVILLRIRYKFPSLRPVKLFGSKIFDAVNTISIWDVTPITFLAPHLPLL